MPYYVAPETPETDFLTIGSPTEIRLCDPACGSGHMLTYAFDLLHLIYEEEGFDPAEIPALILRHNLFGVEIDERAGGLAAFALVMKAAQRRGRRFLRAGVRPNICMLDEVRFRPDELDAYMAAIGRDLFTADLRATLAQFAEAKNFGSLIRPKLADPAEVRRALAARGVEGNLFLRDTHAQVLRVLEMAEYLSTRYHVVVANPPYMGGKGMNPRLSEWLKREYTTSKSDLFAAFIAKGVELSTAGGFTALVTMESWMFLSSYENMRKSLLENGAITNMLHMPYVGRGGTSMGINFGTSAFVYQDGRGVNIAGRYICVRYFETDTVGVPFTFPVKNERFGTASSNDFFSVPGAPIAYWLSEKTLKVFKETDQLKNIASPRQGMATTNNALFLRQWFEVSLNRVGFGLSPSEARASVLKWFPINRGGEFRRWFGNNDNIVNYSNMGREICEYIDNTPDVRVKSNGRVINRDSYFRAGLTWSTISSGKFAVRYSPEGSIFETKGAMIFLDDDESTFSVFGL